MGKFGVGMGDLFSFFVDDEWLLRDPFVVLFLLLVFYILLFCGKVLASRCFFSEGEGRRA